MKVKLLRYTPEADKLIASAAKLCYSPVGVEEIEENLSDEKVAKFLDRLMKMGHESPIEHINFTFGIEGVSRVLTHQLVRHRHANYSQQSQRYVDLKDTFEYIIPTEIEKHDSLKEDFDTIMEDLSMYYRHFTDKLEQIYIKKGMDKKSATKKAIENARYVLPNACETKIVVTMNARALFNFFKHRCCNRAQDEIRELADEMLREVKEVASNVFKYAGASCMHGKCPEGKMTCDNPRKGKSYEN